MTFEKISTGDTVLVKEKIHYGSWSRNYVLVYLEQTVTKVTKTQFTTSAGKKFQIRSGCEIGGDTYAYYPGRQKLVTQETLTATPEEEISRIRDGIKLAERMATMTYERSKNTGCFYQVIKKPEMTAALQELEAALTRINDIVEPKKITRPDKPREKFEYESILGN